jgi:hypothetical protein
MAYGHAVNIKAVSNDKILLLAKNNKNVRQHWHEYQNGQLSEAEFYSRVIGVLYDEVEAMKVRVSELLRRQVYEAKN